MARKNEKALKPRADGLIQKHIVITLPNGEKKDKIFYGHTQAEIDRKLLAYRGEAAKGRSFSEVADEWQSEHDRMVRYNTADCYKAPLKDVKAEFDGKYISEITPQDCQRFVNNYASSGGLKPRARQTVNLRLMVLNMVMAHGVNMRDIEYNPAQYVQLPRGLGKKKRLDPDETQLREIKKDAEGFRLYPLLLLYTGMRKTEALALTWADIDFKAKLIHVTKIVEYHGTKPVRRACTKSEAGMRDIPLLDPLAKVMMPLKGKGYIFQGKDGGMMTKGEFDWQWSQLGLGITAHQLRHAYATQMYEAGIDAEVAQVLLGVSSVKVVRDIYTHIHDDKVKAAAEALNASLKGK